MKSTPSASRVACEPMMLVIASTVAPRSRAMPHRRERVGGLARLRDADHEVARADDRVAVAVLGGDRPSRPGRAPTPRSRSGRSGRRGRRCRRRRRRSACTSRRTLVVERAVVAEVDPVAARGAVGDRLGDGVGLLVDLLEHERLVAALLGGLLVPVDRRRPRARRPSPSGVEERRRRRAARTTISPFSMYCTRRVSREERGDRGGEELLAVAAADDQRALLARADEHVRARRGSSRRTRSGRRARRRRARTASARSPSSWCGDQVRDHLGVGLGGEHGARRRRRRSLAARRSSRRSR